MEFISAKLDGVDILRPGIQYTLRDWEKIVTSDQSEDLEASHGRIVSPTYARFRIVTIEGIIDRMDGSISRDNVSHLRSIFSLQNQTLTLEERELIISDIYGQEWKMQVKIKEPLEIIEGDFEFSGSHWKWRVVIETTSSPVSLSTQEQVVLGGEGEIGGFTMDFTLDSTWEESFDHIDVYTGNIQTDTRFVLTAIGEINAPIKIYNITQENFFELDISASAGDIIEIDSEKFTATQNGVNILAQRKPGSVWQKISGHNRYIVMDKDGIKTREIQIQVYFSNAQL